MGLFGQMEFRSAVRKSTVVPMVRSIIVATSSLWVVRSADLGGVEDQGHRAGFRKAGSTRKESATGRSHREAAHPHAVRTTSLSAVHFDFALSHRLRGATNLGCRE
jgi:hypothetical protein